MKKQTWTAQLDAELASILAVRPDLEVVALADGAEENWRYFARSVYDKATKIVDHGHASQHLRAAMAVLRRAERRGTPSMNACGLYSETSLAVLMT